MTALLPQLHRGHQGHRHRPGWSPRPRASPRASSSGCGTCRTTWRRPRVTTATSSTTTSATSPHPQARTDVRARGPVRRAAGELDRLRHQRCPLRLRACLRGRCTATSSRPPRASRSSWTPSSSPTPPAPQPVTPYAGYDTQTTGKDSPAATQIGVTVTALVLRQADGAPRHDLHPDRGPADRDDPAQAHRRRDRGRHRLGDRDQRCRVADGGLLNLAGSLTYASNAAANLAAASGGLATGEQASGASASLAAPPAQTATTPARQRGIALRVAASSPAGAPPSSTCPR